MGFLGTFPKGVSLLVVSFLNAATASSMLSLAKLETHADPTDLWTVGLALCLLFLEETYPPVILVAKAADLRRRTKNWGV